MWRTLIQCSPPAFNIKGLSADLVGHDKNTIYPCQKGTVSTAIQKLSLFSLPSIDWYTPILNYDDIKQFGSFVVTLQSAHLIYFAIIPLQVKYTSPYIYQPVLLQVTYFFGSNKTFHP